MISSSGASPSNAFNASSALPPAGYSPPATFSNLGGSSAQPNGTASNPTSTTRILQLTNFSRDLKTRDIQGVFAEWEDERGGFKIKWVDDTSCLIVFADAGVAKRAFLSVLAHLPPQLAYPADPAQSPAKLRAYAGNDVTNILTSVQNRPRARSNAGAHHATSSSISGVGGMHSRNNSTASAAAGSGVGRRPSVGSRPNPNRPGLNGSANAAKAVQELIDDITATTSSATKSQSVPTDENAGEREKGSISVSDAGKRFVNAGLGRNGHGRSGSVNEARGESPSSLTGLRTMTIEELPEVPTPRAESHPTF